MGHLWESSIRDVTLFKVLTWSSLIHVGAGRRNCTLARTPVPWYIRVRTTVWRATCRPHVYMWWVTCAGHVFICGEYAGHVSVCDENTTPAHMLWEPLNGIREFAGTEFFAKSVCTRKVESLLYNGELCSDSLRISPIVNSNCCVQPKKIQFSSFRSPAFFWKEKSFLLPRSLPTVNSSLSLYFRDICNNCACLFIEQ